jgi:hypothetical protein
LDMNVSNISSIIVDSIIITVVAIHDRISVNGYVNTVNCLKVVSNGLIEGAQMKLSSL